MSKWLNTLFRAGVLSSALSLAADGMGAERVIRAHDFAIARGETKTLFVSLESLGDENALGFTLCYDTNLLELVPPVNRGSGISNLFPSATFTPNTIFAADSGWIGIVIGLDYAMAQTWPAGTNSIVEVQFRALPGVGSSNTTVSICSSVTALEVADESAQSVPVSGAHANVVVQGACAYQLNTNALNVDFSGGSNSVNVLTDFVCDWTVENTNSWITVTAGNGGTGAGTVSLSIAPNADFSPRIGTLTIAGRTYTVNQAAFVCSFALAPVSRQHSHTSETNALSLTTSNQCSWVVENTNAWISIHSAANGTGSAFIDYSVAANPTITTRTGLVSIAGEVFTIVQAPLPCEYTLTPESGMHGPNASTNSFSVTAPVPCAWTASTTNGWISILSTGSGSGGGTVEYSLDSNPSNGVRSGAILLNGEVFTVTQAGALCDPVFSPSAANHSFGFISGSVDFALPEGCAWNVINTNDWIAINSATSGSGSGSVAYTVSSNQLYSTRAGVLTIGGEDFVIVQESAPCPIQLSISNAVYGSGVTTGTVDVVVSGPCAWTTQNANTWITILSGGGSGSGTVSYRVAANPQTIARTANLTIAGIEFSVTQQAAECAYVLSQTNAAFGFGAANGSFTIMANTNCAWTVENTNEWITIQSGISGTGTGLVTYAVSENVLSADRSGFLIIGAEAFAVTQSGASCSFSISPSTRAHGPSPATNNVVLTSLADCSWTISNVNSWVTFPAGTNGVGSATNIYYISTNPDPVRRTGVVMVASRVFTIIQNPGPCQFTLHPVSRLHGSAAENGSFDVETHAVCSWTAVTTNGWISITGGGSGTGTGLVNYAVQANTNGATRTGYITINGRPYMITQSGLPCEFTLSPTNGGHGFDAATSTVTVSAMDGCEWNVSNTNDWITINSSTNGIGAGAFTYSVLPNASTFARSAAITVAGIEFVISQAPAPCTYALVPVSAAHAAAQSAGALVVETAENCEWNASTTNSWVRFTSATNGIGTNTVEYLVEANPNPAERIGGLFVNGQLFVITQQALICEIAITPQGRSHTHAAEGGNIGIMANGSGCAWSATTSNTWISLLNDAGSGHGSVDYFLAANPTAIARTGSVQVAGHSFTVVQSGAPCSFALTPSAAVHGHLGASNSFTLTTLVGCTWQVENTNAWVTILSPTNNSGSAAVNFLVAENISVFPRTGNLLVAGEVFTIAQEGAPCVFEVTPLTRTHPDVAATNSISLTMQPGCTWTVSNAVPWITITSPLAATNSGLVNYVLEANPTVVARTGEVMIAGQVVTIIQQGILCSYAIEPANRSHGYEAVTNSFSLTTLGVCLWNVNTTNEWITIRSFETNNFGSAFIEYSLAENAVLAQRTGAVQVADQTFIIVQDAAPCPYEISPLSRSHSYWGATNSVTLTTPGVCTWSVVNTNDWIQITSPLDGVDSASIDYVVAENPFSSGRTGTIIIANLPFTVVQEARPCVYTFSATNAVHGPVAEQGAFTIFTSNDCPWTATSPDSWITVLNPSGFGDTEIRYTVTANPAAVDRTGTIVAGGNVFVITQTEAPCPFELTPLEQTFTAAATTGTLSVVTLADCEWTASTTNEWITVLHTNLNLGSGAVDYVLAENPFIAERVGFVFVDGQMLVITQQAFVCVFTLEPANRLHSSVSETGLVAVAAGPYCSWGVINTNTWITLAATDGVGEGTVGYTVEANPTALERSGVFTIGDQSFTVTQSGAACSFSLGAAGGSHDSSISTGSVSVTTLVGCVWDVVNDTPWISIELPLTRTNSGTVNYAVAANPTALIRTGVVTIAEQSFTVVQSGAACIFALSTNSASHGAVVGTNSVPVSTLVGCEWAVANTNEWIEILSGTIYTNSGEVVYAVQANPTALPRTGSITIQGVDFTITQDGAPCAFALGSINATHGFAAAGGSVNVTTLVGCTWTAATAAEWISVLSPANNTNSGSVTYSVAGNPTALSRTGSVSIAGQTFTVVQSGAPCSFALTTNFVSHLDVQQTNSVLVETLVGCSWTVSNETSWIEILSPLGNSGSTSVTYRVLANPDALWRTGVVMIAGIELTIAQSPAACSFVLSTNSSSHGAGVAVASVEVSTLLGCAWEVSTTAPWVHLESALFNTNSGTVAYRLDANPTGISRIGTIQIGSAQFTITQAGAPCFFDLDSFGVTHDGNPASGVVQVSTLVGCTWTVVNTNSWITINTPLTNTSSGPVSYSISENPTALPRSAIVKIAGQDFFVEQAGSPCQFSLASIGAMHGPGAATNSVGVTTLLGCTWTVENTNSWIFVISPLNNTNNGSVSYRVVTNATALTRVGVLVIAGQEFTVTQLGADCTFALSTNAAAHSFTATNGNLNVTTLPGCVWMVSTSTPWLSIQSSLNNSNSGIVNYSVAANPTALSRTGTVIVAGLTFTVTQAGAPCTFALGTSGTNHTAAAVTNTVSVTTLVGCTWTPSNGTPWITILSPLNNTNGGAFTYSLAANPTALVRSGVINVGGQAFTVTQQGAACSFALSSNSVSFGFNAATGEVAVTTLQGCVWTAATATPWLQVTSPSNNTNSGLVRFIVQANSTALSRTGLVTVAGQEFTVIQSGAPCSYGLSASHLVLASTTSTTNVAVTTLVGCSWSASTVTPWIQVLSSLNNTNSGVVSFNVLSNATALWRTGIVSIAGQNVTIAQAGAPCSFLLASNSAAHGPGIATNSVAVTTLVGCTWNISNGAPWITVLSSLNNSNSGVVSYSVATNSSALPRAAILNIGGQNFTVSQNGTPCSYALSAPSASHGPGVEANSVTVTTVTGCSWTVLNSNPWITIQSPLNNTNSGVVNYTVSSNISVLSRTGIVSIAGQTFTVTQAPGLDCTLALQSSNWMHRPTAEYGVIGVQSLTGCSWEVVNTNAWITVLTGPRIAGTNHVIYSVAANTNGANRLGFVTIAGLPFGVGQAGLDCVYRLSPTNRVHGSGANSNSFAVTAGSSCAWGVINTNDWINIISNAVGAGNLTVGYGIERNFGTTPRAGYVNVGGETLFITQWGTACGFSANPPIRNHGAGAESSTVPFNASSGTCNWTVVNTNTWITITSATSGQGATSVSYSVAANTSGSPRQGVFTIGGAMVTVNQSGVPCSFIVTGPSSTHGSSQETGSIAVAAGSGCPWYVFNTNSWIEFDRWSGTNSGALGYTVQANPTIQPRSGVVIVAGQTLIISQNGAPCTFAFAPAQRVHGPGVENGSFDVLTLAGCDWDATANVPWIVVTVGSDGQSSGTVGYAVLANNSVLTRTGAVNVAGQSFPITQSGSPCQFALSASSASHGGNEENGSVDVITDPACEWTIANPYSWITITTNNGGFGSRTVGYTVAENPVFTPRSGTIVIAGQNFTISQAARPCTYVFAPANATFSAVANSGSFSITASNQCNWTVVNSNSWITVTSVPTNGNGNGSVSFSVAANTGTLRMGNIYVGGTPFVVTQAGAVRVVRAVNMNIPRGHTNRLRIVLESTGEENAIGASIVFDTNQLTFLQMVRGPAASNLNASFSPNSTPQALAQGTVGFQMGLDVGTGTTFPIGSNVLAEVLFRAAPGTTFSSTSVGFTNSPVFNQISDPNANVLPATYVPATVNLIGACNFAVGTNAFSAAAGGGSFNINVTAQSLCDWQVLNSNSWITIHSGAGIGSGVVNFTVAANPTGLVRSGVFTISGVSISVMQAGLPCSFSILPGNRSHGASAEGGVVSVTGVPGCGWTVANTNSWITILSSTNGVGSSDVAYALSANSSSQPRAGVVTIAGQSFTVNQTGSACVYVISPMNRAHGAVAENGLITVSSPGGCTWNVINTNEWLTITSSTNGIGNGSVTYSVAYNADGQGRSGVVMIAGVAYTVVQAANPCPVVLAPTSRNHTGDAETNSISVSAGACGWSASNTNSWIVLLNSIGTGNGTLNYRITANPTLSPRSGTFYVSGRPFTIHQAGASCLYALAPTSNSHGYAVETGLVTLATFGSCNWTIINTNTWIAITTPTNGTASANIGYAVAENPSSLVRTGWVSIAGLPFSIVQTGAPCSVVLSTTSTNYTSAAQSGTVSVTTPSGCHWTVSNTNAWISILTATNQTSSGVVAYSLAPNGTALTRVGTILLGDKVYTISQTGVGCTWAISPTNRLHSFSAASNTVAVTTPTGCPWVAENTNTWLSIVGGASGSSNGLVSYLVSANPTAFARTGTVTIAGQTFTVTQSGAPCTYTLSTTNILALAVGDLFAVGLTTFGGCSWTVTTPDPWIYIVSELSGNGSTTVEIFAFQNELGSSRTGRVNIANQTLTIRQSGQPCAFVVSPTNMTHAAATETNAVLVNTLTGCPWTVSTTNSWITFPNGTNYSSSNALTYVVAANPISTSRTGTVMVAGRSVSIVQAGVACTYSLSSSNITLGSGNVQATVAINAGGNCTWETINTNAWISIKAGHAGTNSGLVRFTVEANPLPSVRVGNLQIGGIAYQITQLGSPCSYQLSSAGRLHGSLYETGQVSLFTVSECGWAVDNTNDWITITSAQGGLGTAIISYSVAQNPGFTDRVGSFLIADQTYTVTQLGAACSFSVMTNGAYHGALMETGQVFVVAPNGCDFTVAKSNNWITIQSTTFVSNLITVTYTVPVNVSGAQRIGQITVGNTLQRTLFTVTQATVFCTFAVDPTNLTHGFESENGAISVTTSNPCPWTVLETNTWISIPAGTNYTGSQTVNYIVSANPSGLARTGTVVVAGRPVRIIQAGLVCSYAIDVTQRSHGFLPATGSINVTSPTLCTWNVNRTNSWITITTPTNVTGPSTVNYSLAQNHSSTPRSSVIIIAGRQFTVSQNGAPFILASNRNVNCDVAWDFTAPVNAGNCGMPGEVVEIVSTTTNFGCGPTYTATRIWSATNACGDGVMATQIVNVVQPPPIMACAPNKSVECTSVWTFDSPSAIEYCGGTDVSIRVVSTVTSTNGMCGSTYVVTRTWEATDSCGNKSTCSQSVFIIDTTPPVASWTLTNKTVQCGDLWSFDPPTGTDSCNGTNVTVRVLSTVTNFTGTCGYIATRVWEVADPCGNITTASQVVTAIDTLPPVLACANNKVVECGTGWTFDNPTATDNCSAPGAIAISITSTITNTISQCGRTFTATRTWQAEDGCGNLSYCSQTVRIVDTTPPAVNCAANKTIEYGTPWTFDAPTGNDGCGGTNIFVNVISTSTNAGACGPAFTATRVWEVSDECGNKVSCTQVVTVRDTTPPLLLCSPNKNINCLGDWSFDEPSVSDVGSGTNLAIAVIGTVTNGTCGSGFTATRTWRVTDACGNVSTCSQTAFGRALVTVSGTVFCPTNYPPSLSDKRVAGATLTGPTNTSTTSVADGTYNLVFDAANNVVISPLAPLPADPAEGVTTLDISLVRRHILNVAQLDSPYKLLAGDVDASGSISTLDLSLMRRLVLGLTNRLPAGLWRFVPREHSFADPLNPWDAPTNRSYASVNGDVAGQDFVALKLGDVNSSAGAGAVSPAKALAKSPVPVTFRLGSVTNSSGTSVLVRVTVNSFNQIGTAQGTIAWNPQVARFLRVENFGVDGMGAGNFGTNQAAHGRLSFSWDDPNGVGVSLPDGSVAFAVRLEMIGGPGSASEIQFSDAIAACEATVNLQPIPFEKVHGYLAVTDSTGASGTASAPRLLPSALTADGFSIAVPTVSGRSYILEYTDSLSNTNWIALPAQIGDGGIQILSDPAPASPQRFYRIRIE